MTIPASLTDIANLALTSLGEDTINDITDVSDDIAQQCKRWLDVCVREVQTMIIWDELYTGDPNDISAAYKPEFISDNYAGVQGQFQYLLPANFLKVIEVNSLPPNSLPGQNDSRFPSTFNWKLQNKYIIARVENFEMFYQRFDTNVANWSAELAEVIYTYLASKIAMTITDNSSIAQFATAQYENSKLRCMCSKQNRARNFRKRPSRFTMSTQRGSSNPRRI